MLDINGLYGAGAFVKLGLLFVGDPAVPPVLPPPGEPCAMPGGPELPYTRLFTLARCNLFRR